MIFFMFLVTNPANGNLIGRVPDMKADDAEEAIKCAYKAFQSWKQTTAKVLLLQVTFRIEFNFLRTVTFIYI